MKAMNSLIDILLSIGGQPLLVGGAVVDSIRQYNIKDWDIEVRNVSINDIEAVLLENGFQCDLVGAHFGVIKTKINNLEIDISIPRRESRVGVGHSGFTMEFDPDMSIEDAARRRDLTINSMAKDMVTGEILDPFNGQEDLKHGILRATDPDTFVEDPLRVLRIMQLLPRKGEVVAPDTIELCKSIKDTFADLKSERVFEEFNKLLMRSHKPSKGLNFLVDCEWIEHFPELNNLIGCLQNPKYHPSGDVFEHTKEVIDYATQVNYRVPEDWRLAFMYGCLLHDVGKPCTTRDDFTAYGHEDKGVPIAETFMKRLTNDTTLIKRVVSIVKYHMRANAFIRDGAGMGSWRKLHNSLRLDICAYVSLCDDISRFGHPVDCPHPAKDKCLKLFNKWGADRIPAVLTGRYLIKCGIKPGKDMGIILKKAYDLQIRQGIVDRKILLERSLDHLKSILDIP